MLDTLLANWLPILLRGVAAALFGLAALLAPQLTLGLLVALFAAYAVADGVLSLLVAARARRDPGVRLWLAHGAAGIAVGVLTLLWSDIAVFTVLLLIAVRALTLGSLEVAQAWRLRGGGTERWLLGVAGAAHALFGLTLVVFPVVGVLAVVWWVGLFALAFGAMLVMLGLRLRAGAYGSADYDATAHAA